MPAIQPGLRILFPERAPVSLCLAIIDEVRRHGPEPVRGTAGDMIYPDTEISGQPLSQPEPARKLVWLFTMAPAAISGTFRR